MDNQTTALPAINIGFRSQSNITTEIMLKPGEWVFILGPNGAGKSSLMQQLSSRSSGDVRRIAAHRQTWMQNDTVQMTAASKRDAETNIRHHSKQSNARYSDDYAAYRAQMTVYDLFKAENIRARGIADAVDEQQFQYAQKLSKEQAPLAAINEILKLSNINISISLSENDRLVATRTTPYTATYGAAELSDGERAALLLAADVLTATPGTLFLIDEPERHLHRSITTQLLRQLFAKRRDCFFVVATHDLELPMSSPESTVILLRGFDPRDDTWVADLVPNGSIDDAAKRELLGSRRKILFTEGTEESLDKALYSIIFPNVSVIPKGSCHEVTQAVLGVRGTVNIQWLAAFGIADRDGFDEAAIEQKKQQGIYVLPYYSIEALYFHPRVVAELARRQADVIGNSAEELTNVALSAAVDAVRSHADRLINSATKKAIRKLVLEAIPNDDELLRGQSLNITNPALMLKQQKRAEFDLAVNARDWNKVLTLCSVRETNALTVIASSLRFKTKDDYVLAARHLVATHPETSDFLRGLFGELSQHLFETAQ